MGQTVCFIGHRNITILTELKNDIVEYIKLLIKKENVNEFLFGSKSVFDNFCYNIVTELKKDFPHIKRIYYRSSYLNISETYRNYLLKYYEDTIYPKICINAGKLSYLKRNQAMIDNSDYCIFYYDKNYAPTPRKWSEKNAVAYQPQSGTAIAYKYAELKKKNIKNFC